MTPLLLQWQAKAGPGKKFTQHSIVCAARSDTSSSISSSSPVCDELKKSRLSRSAGIELLHFLPPKFELRPLRKHGHDESRTKVQSVFGTEVS